MKSQSISGRLEFDEGFYRSYFLSGFSTGENSPRSTRPSVRHISTLFRG